jgi:hypothetical protein
VLAAALVLGVAARSAAVTRLSFGGSQAIKLQGNADANSIAAGDLNGDGRADLAIGSFEGGAVWPALRKPEGGFAVAPAGYTVGGSPAAIAIGDLNGDGRNDLAVAGGTGAKTVSILLNRGDGTFLPAVEYATWDSPQGVVLADVDGDSSLDVVTADSAVNAISVLLNRGNGTLKRRVDFRTGKLPAAVAAGDLNHDGRPDLVTANSGAAAVSVLLDSKGTFRARTTFATGGASNSVALADFDGDGNLDIATANPRAHGRHGVSILLGRGDGTFRPRRDYGVGAHASRIAAADLNGDGRPDLALSDDGALGVLLNRGNGTFEQPLWFGLADALAAGDFNRDGRLDLAGAFANERNGRWNVTAHVNTPGLCNVQLVLRKTLAVAKQLLARANCSLGAARRVRSARIARGRVIKQSPRFPGGVLAGGGKVALVISRGRR